ncbi:glycoside hydrolase family 76 protein [Bombardia bombarda]|uniref:Mannan endo-1,6-alpha-mannosidase n=1 Tax=Bombardia bombarda TaxID=252184 RepID=A0AA40CG46_9PEZI|nr:glycoside hydrolase family 76 protein [Bombardia bombarda]
MKFYKSVRPAAAAVALIAPGIPKNLDVSSSPSIQSIAKTIAAGAMAYYPGDATHFVDLPDPYYWWETGALFGAMVDYSHYTGDHSYDPTIATAILAQAGPSFDYMLPKHYGDEGNDDQAFWGFAVMAAAESNFPQPNTTMPSWLDMSENIWNSLASRWDMSACNGGMLWQIFASNPNGLTYKNSVSNGGFFQLSARLARATGNSTYADWATKVWDWSKGVGLLDGDYNVYDGTNINDNCTTINHQTFSYSQGIYLYGAAVMANSSRTADDQLSWTKHTEGLLKASGSFFTPYPNATDIMYEHACELGGTCNTDMRSFKGYLSRFMSRSARLVPSIAQDVNTILSMSARGAGFACTGGASGTTCGQKWYMGGFDGTVGLGEEMCALETIHGLLAKDATPPFKGDDIQTIRSFSS